MTTSATFDGSGGTYLTRTALDATKTYPFWVGAWVRWVKNPTFGTVYCFYSSERADGSQGTVGDIYQRTARAIAVSGGGFDVAASTQAVIPDPYWDHILLEFRSNTDRRVWINGVQEGADTDTRTIDLSAGSPVTRIGIRAGGSQPFAGQIADVAIGTGTISDADRATLATAGATISGITGIAHHYPLQSNGNDSIGSLNMTESGTVSYTTGRPAVRSAPTAADIIQEVFKQAALRSESPTVTTGQTSPIAGLTNLSDCEFIDCAFTGSAGAWNTRMFHFVPTSQASPTHLVIVTGGHQFSSEWATYNLDDVVSALVAAGFGVLLYQAPGYSSEDPIYTGSTPDHNANWSSYTSSVNPLERFLGCQSIALNNLAARYTYRSYTGLSGGGWSAAHYAAMDSRINHSIVPIRGTMAHRRMRVSGVDFEQEPKAYGWKSEEAYRLCAVGNRRLWLVHHQNDPVIGAIDATDNAGVYTSAASYWSAFLAPILAAYPLADLRFIEDQGSAPHAFTSWTITNAIMAAVKRGLTITARGGAGGLPVFGS